MERGPKYRPEEAKEPKIETRESKERGEYIVAAKQAILSWMKRLDQKPREVQEKLKRLPEKYRLGANFVPAFLFTAAMGCNNYELEIVECSQAEADYNAASVDWIINHPDEIQEQMDIIWPDAEATADELVNALKNAEIECGLVPEDSDWGAQYAGKDLIIIGVNTDRYETSLQQYEDTAWIEEYNMNELVEISHDLGDNSVEGDFILYHAAIASNTEYLAHESAHLVLGNHSKEVSGELEELKQDSTTTSSQTQQLDEIYAWGGAAYDAVFEWTDEMQHKYF